MSTSAQSYLLEVTVRIQFYGYYITFHVQNKNNSYVEVSPLEVINLFINELLHWFT